MLSAERLSSKFHSCNCSFFGQSFSFGHYPPIYQPPKGIYLLIIPTGNLTRQVAPAITSANEIFVFVT